MRYMTSVPNEVFDVYLRELKPGELKVLLVVVRQTLGYVVDSSTTRRRDRVWLSRNRLAKLTGLSKKAISQSITGLIAKSLIEIVNEDGRVLTESSHRAKASRLIFRLAFRQTFHQSSQTSGKVVTKGNQAVYFR